MHQHMEERQPGGQGIGRVGAVEIGEFQLRHHRLAGGVRHADGGAAGGAQQHGQGAEHLAGGHVIQHRRRCAVGALALHHQLAAQQKVQ